MNSKIPLRIIPAPADRPVHANNQGDTKPIFTGTGSFDLTCGKCSHVLAESVGRDQLKVVFLCPICGEYNDTQSN